MPDYFLDVSPTSLADVAPDVYRLAWRHDHSQPGFALIRLGPDVDSHALRAGMIALKNALSAIHERRVGRPFHFRSMARFDQQETTKFHLDGAPEESLLMLGYEPTTVPSELAMADYSRAAAALGLTPQRFLVDHNPMFRKGQAALEGYITRLDRNDESSARILLVNNSSAPLDPVGQRPQGVMHQATILAPDVSARRVINSTMLVVGGVGEADPFADRLDEFVRTTHISPKVAY